MTKPDLMAELAEVVRLSERDSVYPGPWHWSANGNIVTDTPLTGCDPEIAAVYSERDDDAAPDNAKLIIAAVNFLRTHHAELEAAVRDAIPMSAWEALLPGTYYMDPPDGGDVSVYEQMRRMAKDAARYRHIKSAPAGTVRTDFHAWAPSYYHWGNGKALDEQIDQAMHNSAREG